MTIFVVETCMVKPDKYDAFKLLMERVHKYKEEKLACLRRSNRGGFKSKCSVA